MTGVSYPGSVSDSFNYNGLGARVSTSGTNGSRTFRRAGIGVTSSVLDDGTRKYTPGVSSRNGSTSTFQHSGLKNATEQSNSSQSVTASRKYDAFGNVQTSSGTWQGPFGYAGSFGYQEDPNGLKLLGHRYYDSGTGRFVTRDPLKHGRNWYSYTGGNPISYVDPNGFERLVIIRGKTKSKYERGVQEYILEEAIRKLTAAGWTVDVLDDSTREEAHNALSTADGIAFLGHGAKDFGESDHGLIVYQEDGEEPWAPDELFASDLMKMRLGAKFTFIWYLTCFSSGQRGRWSDNTDILWTYNRGLNQWTWKFARMDGKSPFKRKDPAMISHPGI